jgi:MerR family transcriptional regulator, light-induced transcriptional regulator
LQVILLRFELASILLYSVCIISMRWPDMYSIKKVSELLGIPAVTIRAWENRYQVIKPIRSSGGHRLYSDEDINTLKWIQHQIEEKGMKISEAVGVLKQKTLEHSKDANVEPHFEKDVYNDVLERLYLDLINLNTAEAHKTIDLAFSLYHYSDVFHEILTRVLYRIGEEWEKGNITVSQEHFSSQLIMQRCSQFLRVLPIKPHLPKVLSMCPEGEHHHMGLMLFSLFLQSKGMDTIYLGPNTPLQDLPLLIGMKNISIVAISTTDPSHVEMVETYIELCRQEYPNVKFALGGTGFTHCKTPLSSYVLSRNKEDWEEWYRLMVTR